MTNLTICFYWLQKEGFESQDELKKKQTKKTKHPKLNIVHVSELWGKLCANVQYWHVMCSCPKG